MNQPVGVKAHRQGDKMEPLRTWLALNHAIRDADEKFCRALLRKELKGKKRKMFIYRIHSRINKIRADRERMELKSKINLALNG